VEKNGTAMEYKAGSRWKSTVCGTEVVVVRPPTAPVTLACGGADLVPLGDDAPSGGTLDPALAEGTKLGKRYSDEAVGIEVLCTKPGDGTLTVDGRPLGLQGAKPLPASD
jgi:hypothetical protein